MAQAAPPSDLETRRHGILSKENLISSQIISKSASFLVDVPKRTASLESLSSILKGAQLSSSQNNVEGDAKKNDSKKGKNSTLKIKLAKTNTKARNRRSASLDSSNGSLNSSHSKLVQEVSSLYTPLREKQKIKYVVKGAKSPLNRRSSIEALATALSGKYDTPSVEPPRLRSSTLEVGLLRVTNLMQNRRKASFESLMHPETAHSPTHQSFSTTSNTLKGEQKRKLSFESISKFLTPTNKVTDVEDTSHHHSHKIIGNSANNIGLNKGNEERDDQIQIKINLAGNDSDPYTFGLRHREASLESMSQTLRGDPNLILNSSDMSFSRRPMNQLKSSSSVAITALSGEENSICLSIKTPDGTRLCLTLNESQPFKDIFNFINLPGLPHTSLIEPFPYKLAIVKDNYDETQLRFEEMGAPLNSIEGIHYINIVPIGKYTCLYTLFANLKSKIMKTNISFFEAEKSIKI